MSQLLHNGDDKNWASVLRLCVPEQPPGPRWTSSSRAPPPPGPCHIWVLRPRAVLPAWPGEEQSSLGTLPFLQGLLTFRGSWTIWYLIKLETLSPEKCTCRQNLAIHIVCNCWGSQDSLSSSVAPRLGTLLHPVMNVSCRSSVLTSEGLGD